MRILAWLAFAALLVAGSPAGDRAFRDGRYEAAAAEYRRALESGRGSPALFYNLGTSVLRLGRFDEAREPLDRAARAEDAGIRQPAHYNAGNADLEPAFRASPSAERRAALQRAIERYRQALLLDSSDRDAKWNLELAQRLLIEEAGGGGADDPRQGGGGGGGGDDRDSPSRMDPSPAPAGGPGPEPQMTPAEAERVLQTAAERERELQQQKLRRTQSLPPNVRDW